MDFGNHREKSVKIGNIKHFGCLPENVGCIPLAVVIMTTANNIHPTFSGKYPKLFIISDIFRVITEFAEVHMLAGLSSCAVGILMF